MNLITPIPENSYPMLLLSRVITIQLRACVSIYYFLGLDNMLKLTYILVPHPESFFLSLSVLYHQIQGNGPLRICQIQGIRPLRRDIEV